MFDRLSLWFGTALSTYLSKKVRLRSIAAPATAKSLLAALRPGDVLLVEGDSRISVAIKYLTQSTWSHAALYGGTRIDRVDSQGRACTFLEADIRAGVRAVSVAEYEGLHCRICRPISLAQRDIDALIDYVVARLGNQYDLKNVIDLARYLLPTPPVPIGWRRRMLALGSGDPTRAVCSTLIAQAFQSVKYPILPDVEQVPSNDPQCTDCVEEILHVRHHSLFVPRDFDVSPYFQVIKPGLARDFDHRVLRWRVNEALDAEESFAHDSSAAAAARSPTA